MPSPAEALNAGLDSFSLLANANLEMDQMHREGFKAALPTCYRGLANVPDPPTELLFGDLDTWMKDLDEKAKLEDTLQSLSPPPPSQVYQGFCASQCRKGLCASCFCQEGQFPFPFVLLGIKKLASFPHNDGQPVSDSRETTQRKEVACQKVNTFLFPPLVVDQLADVSLCYETWADITTDYFVLDIVKHGIPLDFCSQAFCSNYSSMFLNCRGYKGG